MLSKKRDTMPSKNKFWLHGFSHSGLCYLARVEIVSSQPSVLGPLPP